VKRNSFVAALLVAMTSIAAVVGSGPGPASAAAATPGVTATEIHLGAMVNNSIFGDNITGAKARIARENAKGGVNGRKLVIDTVVDDKGDNTTDLNGAKQLAAEDIFAVAPVATVSFAGADYLNLKKIPVFGWSTQPVWCGKQYLFGYAGNNCDPSTQKFTADLSSAYSKLVASGTMKGANVAVITEDNDAAKATGERIKTGFEAYGSTVFLDSSLASPPTVVGDYTPYAQKIMTSNNGKPADLVQMLGSPGNTLGLYGKLKQLGYTGSFITFTLYDPRVAAFAPGMVANVTFAAYEEAPQVPAVAQMIADLKAQDPNVVLTQGAASGYWTMDILIAMLKKTGKNLTRDSFMKVANNFAYDYAGAASQVKFPRDHSHVPVCASFVRSDGTKYVVVAPFKCYPENIPNPLYKKK
jgi:hypothetical protein